MLRDSFYVSVFLMMMIRKMMATPRLSLMIDSSLMAAMASFICRWLCVAVSLCVLVSSSLFARLLLSLLRVRHGGASNGEAIDKSGTPTCSGTLSPVLFRLVTDR